MKEEVKNMVLFYIALIGFAAGLVKGTSGFGSSLVAFPLLILFFPEAEVVIMLITFNVVLNTLLLFENKAFEFSSLKSIWVLTLMGVIATLFGLYVIGEVSSPVIKLIASLLIVFAIINKTHIFKISIKDNWISQSIAGIVSGIGNGMASIDGPPVVFYLTGIDAPKAKFKNTLATYFLTLAFLSVIILISLGKYNIEILQNTAYVGFFAGLGVIAGMLISKKLNEQMFSNVVVVLLLILGANMMYDFIVSLF